MMKEQTRVLTRAMILDPARPIRPHLTALPACRWGPLLVAPCSSSGGEVADRMRSFIVEKDAERWSAEATVGFGGGTKGARQGSSRGRPEPLAVCMQSAGFLSSVVR